MHCPDRYIDSSQTPDCVANLGEQLLKISPRQSLRGLPSLVQDLEKVSRQPLRLQLHQRCQQVHGIELGINLGLVNLQSAKQASGVYIKQTNCIQNGYQTFLNDLAVLNPLLSLLEHSDSNQEHLLHTHCAQVRDCED